MSEFLIIQVGQCGNQIGHALWPLILQEYDISLYDDVTSTNCKKKGQQNLFVKNSLSSFFNVESCDKNSYNTLSDLTKNKVTARAVCIDMEESVVTRFKNGHLRDLFNKNCLITNYPGSGNNWAEGFCEHGPKYKDKILKAICEAMERCDSLHGFLILFSTGGGTGSGLGTYILQLLADEFPNIERFVCCVYPIGTEDVITCPYNMALASQEMINNATCVFPVENRSLLEIMSRQIKDYKSNHFNTFFKPFEDLNSIIVNQLLHLTSGSRFPGSLNFDMNELNTNMVPFPKMHFLCSGFSSLQQSSIKINKTISKQVKDELFLSSCNRSNQLLKMDPLGPKSVLLGSTLIGRGGYSLSDMRSYIDRIQSKANFTPWSMKSVKVGLCSVPLYKTSIGMFSLFNTSSMSDLFLHVYNQYSKLYQKKAHIHHYTKMNNFDVDNFKECEESLLEIINLYEEVKSVQPANIPRLTALGKI